MAYTFRNIKGDVLDFAEFDENYRYTEELFQLTEAASTVSVAASNFKGPWAVMSGALNIPASVSHAGNYWMLVADVLAVETEVPGISPAWEIIPLGVGDPSASIHAAAAKPTPADADEWGYLDSAAGFGLVKGTWANIKAAIKAWIQTQALEWTGLQKFTEYQEKVYTASVSASHTIDLANGSLQIFTHTGNTAFTLPTPVAGKSFTTWHVQDGTGSRIPTFSATARHAGSTAPVFTTTAGKTDVIGWVSDGTYWLSFVGGLKYTRA